MLPICSTGYCKHIVDNNVVNSSETRAVEVTPKLKTDIKNEPFIKRKRLKQRMKISVALCRGLM